MYTCIVFLKGKKAENFLRRIPDYGRDKVIKLLTVYDEGVYYDTVKDYKDEIRDTDFTHKKDEYILVWNTRQNRIGLYKEIT